VFISRGTTKSRTIPGPAARILWQEFPGNNVINVNTDLVAPTGGTQVTESDSNFWPPPKGKHGRIQSDYGSEFYTRKCELIQTKYPFVTINYKAVPNFMPRGRISGHVMLANAFGSTSRGLPVKGKQQQMVPQFPDLSSSRSQLEVKGTIAVAACAPTNQIAQTASAVGELLQDVPHLPGIELWKSRLHAVEAFAAGGTEFLNVVFGILPTVSDMTTFYKAVHKVDKAVDQFIRDSGRTVRRSFYFPTERTETDEELVGDYSPIGSTVAYNDYYAAPSYCFPVYKTRRHRIVERDVWFNGAFTYHLPEWYDTNSRKDRMALTAKLLGAQPDLTTLWQLAPWSWAVDWISDAGAFVKNLQSLISYGTVMRYGYVMETTTVTDTYYAGSVVRGPNPDYSAGFSPPYPAVIPITLRTTTKKRIQANPFGFGLSWDGLSTIQQAIVAALGISRVAR